MHHYLVNSFYSKSSRTIWPYDIARPAVRSAVRIHYRCSLERVGPRGAVNCWQTRAIHSSWSLSRREPSHHCTTVSAIHCGSAFAVRFSRSAIFFISEYFGGRFGLLSKFVDLLPWNYSDNFRRTKKHYGFYGKSIIFNSSGSTVICVAGGIE